uniref:Uncharacterized protein n=1 Tax=Picea glauca TaxID=3330 RepID=A0A124GMU2_PICGL|nr:hypothetical protein ABT39_MTgene1408 [Picea glauca]QHR92391.1 hypothetical protein Q903MT_gene6434 [Picea sitchensis]
MLSCGARARGSNPTSTMVEGWAASKYQFGGTGGQASKVGGISGQVGGIRLQERRDKLVSQLSRGTIITCTRSSGGTIITCTMISRGTIPTCTLRGARSGYPPTKRGNPALPPTKRGNPPTHRLERLAWVGKMKEGFLS